MRITIRSILGLHGESSKIFQVPHFICRIRAKNLSKSCDLHAEERKDENFPQVSLPICKGEGSTNFEIERGGLFKNLYWGRAEKFSKSHSRYIRGELEIVMSLMVCVFSQIPQPVNRGQGKGSRTR